MLRKWGKDVNHLGVHTVQNLLFFFLSMCSAVLYLFFLNGIFAGILLAEQKTGTLQSCSAKCLLSLLFQNKSFSWWQ